MTDDIYQLDDEDKDLLDEVGADAAPEPDASPVPDLPETELPATPMTPQTPEVDAVSTPLPPPVDPIQKIIDGPPVADAKPVEPVPPKDLPMDVAKREGALDQQRAKVVADKATKDADIAQ